MSKDVFFLGAGFSKAIIPEYPTLYELSKYIEDKFQFEKKSVDKHYRDEVPHAYKNNIETLLTYLSSSLPFKTDVQIYTDQALYKNITEKLADYFIEQIISNSKKLEAVTQSISPLLNFIRQNNCTCITLNYDLLLENLISQHCLKSDSRIILNYEKFYKMPITPLRDRHSYSRCYNSGDDFLIEELPNIIKLHGSINWLYSGMTPIDPIYCKNFDRNQEEDCLSSDLKTFIVPPVLDKNSQYFNIVLKALWRNAYDKLCNAENIYIYGFSFPTTDLSIKFLFQNAIENNPYVKIYVINTKASSEKNNKDYIIERYENIFGKNKCNFDYCCENSLNKFINKISLNEQPVG